MSGRVEIVDPKVRGDSAEGKRMRQLMNGLAEIFTDRCSVAVFVVFGPGGEVHGATKFDPSMPDVSGVPVKDFGDQLFQAAASAVDKALEDMMAPFPSLPEGEL